MKNCEKNLNHHHCHRSSIPGVHILHSKLHDSKPWYRRWHHYRFRPHIHWLLFIGTLFIALGLVVQVLKPSNIPAQGTAGILKEFPFQGRLTNADGTVVSNSNYDVVFKLYTVATDGVADWTESHTGANQIATVNGIFNTNLGSITSLGSTDFNSDTWYLGIAVGADAEMTPRIRLGAAPYAINADQLDGKDSADFALLNSPTLVTPEIGVATGTSLDLGTTTLYASRAITVDTGGVFNIDIGSAAGDDFTVDTDKLVVEGDTGRVGIGTATPSSLLHLLSAGPYINIEHSTNGIAGQIGYAPSIITGGLLDQLGIVGVDGILFGIGASEKMRIASTGNVFIGDTDNANSTVGLTINQGANDNEILSLKSSDIGHPFTASTEADTFGYFSKLSPTNGGLVALGFSDADATALFLGGAIGSADPADTTPAIMLRGLQSNGTTGTAALGNAERVLTIQNSTTDLITVAGNGDAYFLADVSALTFTDRTPYYEGDALTEIMNIKGKDGKIDHNSLPSFAKKVRMKDVYEGDNKVGEEVEPLRDLGAMISIQTVAIQQLIEENNSIKLRLDKLEKGKNE